MQFLSSVILLGLFRLRVFASASGIDPFPVPFSSSFLEPAPPLIPNEFKANYMQVRSLIQCHWSQELTIRYQTAQVRCHWNKSPRSWLRAPYIFERQELLVLIQSQAYFSPSQNKIRIDGSDSEGTFFSSLFDFGNTSAQSEISNRQLMFTGGVKQSQSSCFSEL